MNGRKALVLLVAAGLLLLSACTPQPSLEEDLNAAVKKVKEGADGGQGNGLIRMNYVAGNFSWDKLYIFGPYSTAKSINESLGFKWEEAGDVIRDLKGDEGLNLLVFVQGDEVVRHVKHKRKNGDFLPVTTPLTPDTAVFLADKNKDGWWVFRPVGSGSPGE
ncbi:hypothetical protein [Salinithrix halophila]|uniref:Lipoprotein n=1 Tax=Salinithrix halophila TaxID=1485204 RepID=A0ABV8JGU4_9BACL